MQTRSQRLAQAAFRRVSDRKGHKKFDEYTTFAKKFPALIHTCGLAQAVAFAQAKGASKDGRGKTPEAKYLTDLAMVVLNAAEDDNHDASDALAEKARTVDLNVYLRLSRDALEAAGWLKRYVEAAGDE